MSKEKKSKSSSLDLSGILIKNINSELDGEVAHLVEDGSPSDVRLFVSTGSTLLDYIISNRRDGGIPVGRVSELSGLEGSGKSLLAMQVCANAQKMGGLAVYMDTESAFNSDFASRVGLDTKNNFVYCSPETVEDAFKTIFKILHTLDEREKSGDGKVPLVCVVWDSVAATPTKADIETEDPDPAATVGLKPRILSKNISTLLGSTGRQNVALLFLNQLRTNIRAQPFQDPYITPGGKAIPFASSIRVRLGNKGKVKVKDSIVGIQCEAKCVKTRFGPPYQNCEFPIYFTHGVDDSEAIMNKLIDHDYVEKISKGRNGVAYKLKDEQKEYTDVEFKKEFKTNKEFKNKVLDYLEKVMIKPMIDPDSVSIEVVSEDVE